MKRNVRESGASARGVESGDRRSCTLIFSALARIVAACLSWYALSGVKMRENGGVRRGYRATDGEIGVQRIS
jgi:hypothetical protein